VEQVSFKSRMEERGSDGLDGVMVVTADERG